MNLSDREREKKVKLICVPNHHFASIILCSLLNLIHFKGMQAKTIVNKTPFSIKTIYHVYTMPLFFTFRQAEIIQ